MDQFSDQVGAFQAGRTRLTSTVEDASRTSWDHGGFNLGDLDYYNKGLLAGLIFDAKIRELTHGKSSLDDVMRLMFKRYRLPQAGYQEDGIKEAINQIAGTDLSPLYDSMIRSTAELPYDILTSIGLRVVPPNVDDRTAQGFPFAIQDRDGPQASTRQGRDTFLGFLPSHDESTAEVEIKAKNSIEKLQVPLTVSRSKVFQVRIDPKPTTDQAKRFREWSAR